MSTTYHFDARINGMIDNHSLSLVLAHQNTVDSSGPVTKDTNISFPSLLPEVLTFLISVHLFQEESVNLGSPADLHNTFTAYNQNELKASTM